MAANWFASDLSACGRQADNGPVAPAEALPRAGAVPSPSDFLLVQNLFHCVLPRVDHSIEPPSAIS